MHVLDSLEQHNLIYQNKVKLEYKFFVQLIFLFLYEVTQYVDQLFQQLLHLSSNINLKTPCAAGC